MKTTFSIFLLIILITSFQYSNTTGVPPSADLLVNNYQSLEVEYIKFNPTTIQGVKLDGYDVEDAYKLDSNIIFTAYTNGDLETSSAPVNWGDRLIMMRNGEKQFESKPVGDPYLYEPYFYRNPINGKVIVICQLGNEDKYGGEAFILDEGVLTFMGYIDIETPFDLPENNQLTDIVHVLERDQSIYFEFDSDSLIYLPGTEWIQIRNNNIHYKYSGDSLILFGI